MMKTDNLAVTSQNEALAARARMLVDLSESLGLPLDESGNDELKEAIAQEFSNRAKQC